MKLGQKTGQDRTLNHYLLEILTPEDDDDTAAGLSDDEDNVSDDENAWELDGSQAAFDERAIEDIVVEIGAEEALTTADKRLGCYAVMKVCRTSFRC